MGAPIPRPAALNARLETPIEEWPYLHESTLQKTDSRRICMTCHWFRHHAGVNCIPVLTCQLHQELIAHGEQLVSRYQGWTYDRTRQQGSAPDVVLETHAP
jgi:hypothetical protein